MSDTLDQFGRHAKLASDPAQSVDDALALTIGVLEITAQARQIEEYTFQGFEAFTAATLMYIFVTAIVMGIMRVVEAKVRIPGMISLGAK